MIHIGVDMHKNFSNFAVLNNSTDALMEQRLNKAELVMKTFVSEFHL